MNAHSKRLQTVHAYCRLHALLPHSSRPVDCALHAHSTQQELFAWLCLRLGVRVGVRVQLGLGFEFA